MNKLLEKRLNECSFDCKHQDCSNCPYLNQKHFKKLWNETTKRFDYNKTLKLLIKNKKRFDFLNLYIKTFFNYELDYELDFVQFHSTQILEKMNKLLSFLLHFDLKKQKKMIFLKTKIKYFKQKLDDYYFFLSCFKQLKDFNNFLQNKKE